MKSKRALSPLLLFVILFVVCIAGASVFVLKRKSLPVGDPGPATIEGTFLAQEVHQLTERVAALEAAKPAPSTVALTPDDTEQGRLEKQMLDELIQDRLISTRLTTQGDTVTLSHLPNQEINFFSIPKSIWNEYAKHTFTIGDINTTQLKLELPAVPRQRTSGVLTMRTQRFEMASFVNDTITNSTTTLQNPSSLLCWTANKDYSLEIAIAFFQTKFPQEDWADPCARVQTFNLKPHLVPGETQKKEFRGYLFLPTRESSGTIPDALFSQDRNPLYASAIIIPRIKSEGGLATASNTSERGMLVDWNISFSNADGDEAAFTLEKHKLQSIIDLFMRTAEIPSCYGYGGCY